MARHKLQEKPGWLRAALGAAVKPRRAPVGGFVLPGGPHTPASARRRESLAVPGVQLARAARHPVLPRKRLASGEIPVQAYPPADVPYGDRCAVCGYGHVETAPCVGEPVESEPAPPGDAC